MSIEKLRIGITSIFLVSYVLQNIIGIQVIKNKAVVREVYSRIQQSIEDTEVFRRI